MQPDGEPEMEEAGQVYETGDFVAQFCGTAFGIEHWVCPVTREIVPFSGFVVGPGPQMESATDRYAVQAEAEIPVMVSVEQGEDGSGTVVFRQTEVEESAPELDVVAGRPAPYGQTLLATIAFGAMAAVILLIARRLGVV